MSDNTQEFQKPKPEPSGDGERTKQVTAVSWLAGIFAVVAGITLVNEPSWPVAFGLAAVAVMVTMVSGYILKK
jgi:Flp pilus assembly protein TadB